ncbi:glutathione S-transferase [Amphiplicatus metriothermophilus]|uniref:glutathione transferase n=1 Tax=Amphiplicatus metriothermophilus TaxID=1519374 RepID=A0A239PJ10_9PROT|nr:glutathione S-transferase [Amphiplicatus metriothermophilus]MBB5517908.1 glutathione S-transferase [Amphiplicatus metriothermophilus]SNT67758.1 glutathione S-transferase [Amphiplicatus metriothermophilus]
MIIVHHLENSRSQRVLWLLEELGLEYEVRRYERDRKTNLAPATLRKIHPLGKSPVVEDGGRILAETGAIVEHLVEAHGAGRLVPARETANYVRYKYWIHAAEGSYMPPLVMALLLNRMESAPMPFFARPVARRLANGVRAGYLDQTTQALFDHLDTELSRDEWLAGPDFTAADIMMSFPIEAARGRVAAAQGRETLDRFVEKIHARPAYRRALEKGGPYAYA